MEKRALITGITGQDGSYLADWLLGYNYRVYGVRRRSSSPNTERIDHIYDKHERFQCYYGDMTDSSCINHIINEVKPHEIYNLAAQSHVAVSFEMPEYTAQCDALGVLRLLEAIRSIAPEARLYQAGTSEMFGNTRARVKDENSRMEPVSPYGIAKLFAHNMVRTYRDAYGIFACNGILFNHESPRRGLSFVTKKIVRGAVAIYQETADDPIRLGNLNAVRDWGHARDYVRGMHLMLQHDHPDDYILATGNCMSVRHFATLVFSFLFGDGCLTWEGEGENECAMIDGKPVIIVDPDYYRPIDIEHLQGDAGKARKHLKWIPFFSTEDLIREMISFEYRKQSFEYRTQKFSEYKGQTN